MFCLVRPLVTKCNLMSLFVCSAGHFWEDLQETLLSIRWDHFHFFIYIKQEKQTFLTALYFIFLLRVLTVPSPLTFYISFYDLHVEIYRQETGYHDAAISYWRICCRYLDGLLQLIQESCFHGLPMALNNLRFSPVMPKDFPQPAPLMTAIPFVEIPLS